MKKKTLVIIGGRGIGDLIYHLPLLKSLYESNNNKLIILSNKINQSKKVFKNENFYEKIIEFDNNRQSIFKTIKNIFFLTGQINEFKVDEVILTSHTSRLNIPVFLSNVKDKKIFSSGKFFFNKDKSLSHLSVSEKILKQSIDLNFLANKKDFYLSEGEVDPKLQESSLNIFISIDSHHDHNNWGIESFIKIIEKLIIKKNVFVNFSPKKLYFLKFFNENLLNSKNLIFTHTETISRIIQIIQSCDIVIGNESGPVCLGASLKKKVHSIYSPIYTKPESQIIDPNNNYYNSNDNSSEEIIDKILRSIDF